MITLELIAHTPQDYAQRDSITLELIEHVHKRIEKFYYKKAIRKDSTPIAYIENPQLNSRKNIHIANRTYTISTNSPSNTELKKTWNKVTSKALSSPYKDVLITNQTFVDEKGTRGPLFFRHQLPEDVVECSLYVRNRGNRARVDTGFRVDLDAGAIYTNYRNFFDPDTGAYRLFFVVCSDSDGNTLHQLLNPVPVAKEADWRDVDPTTGKLTDAYPVYTKSKTSDGYTYYMSKSDTWYIKPLEKGLIQPRKPTGVSPKDPWFIRFTNGDFVALVNARLRRYYLPEYNFQPFAPYKPLVYSSYSDLLLVNRNIVATTRRNIKIAPEEGLHISIFVRDQDNILIKALTTNTSLDGQRYSDTDVFYESDKILSWDNQDGLIALGLKIHPDWQLSAAYYYELDDYEYTKLDLNPLNTRDIYDYMVVFYLIPDVTPQESALHHLLVDQGGFIVQCSQSGSISYPNLQLTNPDGSFNPETVIGLIYNSDTEQDTFLRRYGASYENDHAYYVLAEVSVLDSGLVEDQVEIDVRRPGGIISKQSFERAIRSNPKILQSYLGYGEDGQEIPKNAVMIVEAPLTLLEEFGGSLTREEAEIHLKKHVPSAVAAIIQWTYPHVELSAKSIVASQVDLEWYLEGPGIDYKLYRRNNPTDAWVLIDTITGAAPEGIFSYTDSSVVSGEVYFYGVRIVENSIEFPMSNTVGVKVA